uniref:Uncharacterized protein n=1 Tax=Chelonoidis abingdonii TaxID=106734 RepID=A0A8C0GRE7_CHEAB
WPFWGGLSLSGLIQLKTMHLEANRITRIKCSFNSLRNLRKLYLNNNHISSISQAAFSNLKNLQFLHLNKNNLSSLPKHLFAELLKLKYVFLSHNPWNCDCKMLWFPTWIAPAPAPALPLERSSLCTHTPVRICQHSSARRLQHKTWVRPNLGEGQLN